MPHAFDPAGMPPIQDLALLELHIHWDSEPSQVSQRTWAVRSDHGPQGQVQVFGSLRLEADGACLHSEVAALLSEAASAEFSRDRFHDLEKTLNPILWAYTRQVVVPVLTALPTGPRSLPRDAPTQAGAEDKEDSPQSEADCGEGMTNRHLPRDC